MLPTVLSLLPGQLYWFGKNTGRLVIPVGSLAGLSTAGSYGRRPDKMNIS